MLLPPRRFAVRPVLLLRELPPLDLVPTEELPMRDEEPMLAEPEYPLPGLTLDDPEEPWLYPLPAIARPPMFLGTRVTSTNTVR